MKSKTILPEEERLAIEERAMKDYFLAKTYKALVAAEEEIEVKDKQLKSFMEIMETTVIAIKTVGHLKSENIEGVTGLLDDFLKESIFSLKKELESRRLIIERLHNENQALIEENAGLKAKIAKL